MRCIPSSHLIKARGGKLLIGHGRTPTHARRYTYVVLSTGHSCNLKVEYKLLHLKVLDVKERECSFREYHKFGWCLINASNFGENSLKRCWDLNFVWRRREKCIY